jgi:hypothetical protein
MRETNDNYLTPEQRAAVTRVRNASEQFRIARINLEKQLREQLQRELAGMLAVRDNEIRVAYAIGVRKATLKRAIGSKDHATIQNVLSMGGTLIMPETSQINWVDKNKFILTYVDWRDERVYGNAECSVIYDGDQVVAWDLVSTNTNDDIVRLVGDTTSTGDMNVYDAILHAVRR